MKRETSFNGGINGVKPPLTEAYKSWKKIYLTRISRGKNNDRGGGDHKKKRPRVLREGRVVGLGELKPKGPKGSCSTPNPKPRSLRKPSTLSKGEISLASTLKPNPKC
jgi:hypothetical protein